MRRSILAAGIAVLAAAAAATSNVAIADSLTRSGCWVMNFDDGAKRTLCFTAAGHATMSNRAHVINSTTKWSTCEWSADYVRTGNKVTVAFPKGSGRCTNGVASPKVTVSCDFNGDSLPCEVISLVDDQRFDSNYTFR